MKKIITLLFLLASITINAATYYISTSGNDATGDGSVGNPWRTLRKATETVTTPGDIIHVNAGTYLETQQSDLRVGVSIEGDGATSVIQCTITTYAAAIVYATSAEGTNGNQHISNVKFDGRSTATSWAVQIQGRSNFSIYNCTIVDFQDRGIIWGGRNDNGNGPPTIYATGNSFHDNIVTNSATCNGVYGTGCLGIGGQDGMLVYNNTITSIGRAANTNGWPIKYWNEGHLKGVKIYNNNLTSQLLTLGSNGELGFWDFSIELFYEQGLEIYGNTCNGSIDVNFNSKGIYPYTYYIHHNTIGPSSFPSSRQSGIIAEFDTETGRIEYNTIRNCVDGIVFSLRPNSQVTNTRIANNLIYGIGSTGGGYGLGIGNFTDGSVTWNLVNVDVLNNTVVAHPTDAYAPFEGVGFKDFDGASTVKIKNNIIVGFQDGTLNMIPASLVSGSEFQYNDLYDNNYNTLFTTFGGTVNPPGGNTISNNLNNVNPLFVGGNAYLLDSVTPSSLRNAGSDGTNMGHTGGSGNISPTAAAGTDQTITLPTASVSLTGSGTDADGTIASYAWAQVSGPSLATLGTPSSQNTSASVLVQGTYIFRLTVTDNNGATGTDEVQVVVNAAPGGGGGSNPDILIIRGLNKIIF